MKRILNNKIFIFVLGIILSSSVAVIAYSLSSSEISFVPDDNSWEVNNVEDAINSLYDNNKNDEFTFTWCCSNGGSTALSFNYNLSYFTVTEGGGTASYNLEFWYQDNTSAGNIEMGRKYELSSLKDKKAQLSCSGNYKCFNINYSNK